MRRRYGTYTIGYTVLCKEKTRRRLLVTKLFIEIFTRKKCGPRINVAPAQLIAQVCAALRYYVGICVSEAAFPKKRVVYEYVGQIYYSL